MASKEFVLFITFAVTATLAVDPIHVSVATRYITTAETTLLQGETKTFTATLCKHFMNNIVNATVLLNNNPSWDPISGVVEYYIVDSPSKSSKDALCNNTDSKGKYLANCYISHWPSTSDLYLVAKPIQVDSIVLTIDIEFHEPSGNKHLVKPAVNRSLTYRPSKPSHRDPDRDPDMEILTEIVNVRTEQALQYKHTALLNVSFCRNAETTDHYQISSSVFGTDGKSSYTQYLCSGPPCEVGGKTVIGYDGKELPNNNIYLTTESGQYQDFMVLIVCWAGEYDPKVKNYVGRFQYNAQINKTP